MESSPRIMQAIFDAIDELNESLRLEIPLEKSSETVLIGESGALDSMGFVTFAVELEKRIERSFSSSLSLMDFAEELTEGGPCTVARLEQFLAQRVGRPVED